MPLPTILDKETLDLEQIAEDLKTTQTQYLTQKKKHLHGYNRINETYTSLTQMKKALKTGQIKIMKIICHQTTVSHMPSELKLT